MKNTIANFSLLLLFIFILTACQEDSFLDESTEPVTETAFVDNELRNYFSRFELEGRRRGWDVDIAAREISGTIENIHEENVAGTCTYGTFTPGSIVIDESFWNSASEFAKEMVVFHELGHCYLHREHDGRAFSNGICQSIMRSGLEGCFDNYNDGTRAYYLDELFEGATE